MEDCDRPYQVKEEGDRAHSLLNRSRSIEFFDLADEGDRTSNP